ncbi:MAG TPA: hypothetical protein VF469_24985 [Kofleriaceae bacterium]
MDLLQDPGFLKVIDLVANEVMRYWNVPHRTAHGFVLSAIGEPETLGRIHHAWILARNTGGNPGLAKVIVRRRVIDLLRRDARQTNHCSLPAAADADEIDAALAFDELLQRSPRAQLELQQIIWLVRGALACFATQGRIQERQAQLLRRYALDEVQYSELSMELACSENALRVRVHKAMLALRRHIGVCHPELEDVLGRRRRNVTRARVT